jgi:hypothetical protein
VPLALLTLLCGGLRAPLGPPPAVADAAADARKAFKTALKSEAWRDRQEAYLALGDYDGPWVVEEILDGMSKEANPAVVLGAIKVLASLRSAEARSELGRQLTASKGARKSWILLALARQPGNEAVPLLLETVQGKDEPAAAQAALALGQKEVREAIPHLLVLLKSKSWQLRRAGALALANIAQPPPPKPKADAPKDAPPFTWAVPDVMKEAAVTDALVDSLAQSDGRERADLIHALEAVHEKDYGYNLAAWKKVAAGQEPDAKDLAKRIQPPHVFGIPIYGRRVVLMLDNGLRSGDPHRFGSGDRMAELCQVPGGKPIFSARLRTVGDFAQAHYKRCIEDMPKGTQFDVVVYNEKVSPAFGKFTNVSGSSRRFIDELFQTMRTDNAGAVYDAFQVALDLGGADDKKAWKKGPDEIVFMTCSMPTVGEIQDGDVIAAAISLKARLRMVPIHTIGIERHPYAMIDPIAAETGGIYRNYYE